LRPVEPGATRAALDASVSVGRLAVRVIDRTARLNVTGAAGQFAYNAFLATVPFLAILVSVLGMAGSPRAINRLLETFSPDLPAGVDDQLTDALSAATRGTRTTALVLALSVAAGLWIASNAISALMRALAASAGVRGRGWWRGRLVAIGLAACACVVVAATSVALVGGPPLVGDLARAAGLGNESRIVATRLAQPIGVCGLLAFTLLLYRIGIGRSRRALLPGALVAVALWVGATRLMALYVDRVGSYNAVYGSLGVVVVYLVFLWLTGLVLLLGAEVNEAVSRRRAQRDLCDAPTQRWQVGHQ
jgi:membrane protein